MDVAVVRVPAEVLGETFFVKVCFAPGCNGEKADNGGKARRDRGECSPESSGESDSGESSRSAHCPKTKGPRAAGGDYDYDDPFIDDCDAGNDDDRPSLFELMHGDADKRNRKGPVAPRHVPEVGEEAAAAADAVYRALRTDVAVQGVPAMQGVYYVWRGPLGDEGAVRPDAAAAERGVIRKQRGRARKLGSPTRKRTGDSEANPSGNGRSDKPTKKADKSANAPGKDGKRRLVDVLKAIGDDEAGTGDGPGDTVSAPGDAAVASGDTSRAPKIPRKRTDTAVPFAEHELASALAAFRAAAATTPFVDQKKFPSALRPALDTVLCAALRLSHLQLLQRAADRKVAPVGGASSTTIEAKPPQTPEKDDALHMSGRNTPVASGDFVSQPPGSVLSPPAAHTATDAVNDTPKRAPNPSAGTPKPHTSISDNVATVPHTVFEEMARATPFSANALERVACQRAFAMARDEIRTTTLPALYDALRTALFRENTLHPWDDASRRMLYDASRAELDASLLDRVDTLCEVLGLKTTGPSSPNKQQSLAALANTRHARALSMPLNDLALRRTIHARVSAFTTPEGASEPLVKSQTVAFELIAFRRRVETEALSAAPSSL